MRIDVLTLFPGMFAGVLGSSILKRAAETVPHPSDPAQRRGPVVSYHVTDIRDHTTNKHEKVDAPPYGGGPGMVMQCQPVWDAVRAVELQDNRPATRILMTPQGAPLTQQRVEHFARQPRLLIIAGHYEGIDERIIDRLHDEGGLNEVSIGDYVLSGGELPAMVLIDAVVRLLPGALGDERSAHHESFSAGTERRLDHPHYTRPPVWEGRPVPQVLLGGDHGRIAAWRAEQSAKRTAERRPDVLDAARSGAVVVVREESAADADAIDDVVRGAFGREDEARLVRALRRRGEAVLSLVAQAGSELIGHVMLSPVTPADQPSVRRLAALAPLAVRPGYQGRGVGSALVRETIRRAEEQLALRGLVLLGDPAYYTRFGFTPAHDAGFTCKYTAGPEFMWLALRQGQTSELSGDIRFAGAFEETGF